MTSSGPVIRVRDLGKRFRVSPHPKPTSLSDRVESLLTRAKQRQAAEPDEIWALRDVSFDVGRGEVLGVIGPNGAGKSTLLSILARITEPTEGTAEIAGRVSSILEVGTGFHPELSGRDNVFLNGAILGMSRREIAAKFDEIVEFSGVRDFIDVPVKRYSSGMYVRLAFSVTAHLDPDVLLLDEVLAVGDRGFQEKCHERVREMISDQRTVLFVSHDVSSVERLCERAIVIVGGRIGYSGPVHSAIAHYLDAVRPEGEPVAAHAHAPTGPAAIVSLGVANEHGSSQIVAGEPLTIAAELEARASIGSDEVAVELEIADSYGARYVVLSHDLSPDGPVRLEPADRTSLTCRLDELPLREGDYTVTGFLKVRGEPIGRPAKEHFEIVATTFSLGGVHDEDASPVLTRQQWSVGLERARAEAVRGQT